MANARKVRCDKGCGESFDLGGFKKAQIDGGVEKSFFVCPTCGKEYVVAYTDEEIRRLQAEQEKEGKRIGLYAENGDTDGLRKAQKRFDNRAKRIYEKMTDLRTNTEPLAE